MKILIIITSITFLAYGSMCLLTDHMNKEFKRYGLEKYRTLTGYLELLGGAGLLVGLLNKPILLLSASGLAALMFLGVITRIRVSDPWFEILPAFILFLINIAILL